TTRGDEPVKNFLGHAVPVKVAQAASACAAHARPVGRVERVAAVARIERVLLLIFTADVEVEALVVEIAIAPGRINTLLTGVTTLRHPERTTEVEALDFLLGDDVDHARDRVGTI